VLEKVIIVVRVWLSLCVLFVKITELYCTG